MSTTTTTTTVSSWITTEYTPFIRHILVFSANLETVITFAPKHGWLLNDEKKFRLYINGYHLQNSSIVFSASLDDCTSNDYISPVYPLSSTTTTSDILVQLDQDFKAHSSAYLCLLTTTNDVPLSINTTNDAYETKQLDGPYFTFLREKARLPFATKICLILMLFIVSGFFR
jgi:hypothetical protein